MPIINGNTVPCLTPNQITELQDLAYNERVNSIKELVKTQAINPDEKLAMLADTLNMKGTSALLFNWLLNPNNTKLCLSKAEIDTETLNADVATLQRYALMLINIVREEPKDETKKKDLDV